MASDEPFTCPRCGRSSHHPKDIEHGYCGACHDFTGHAVPGDEDAVPVVLYVGRTPTVLGRITRQQDPAAAVQTLTTMLHGYATNIEYADIMDQREDELQ